MRFDPTQLSELLPFAHTLGVEVLVAEPGEVRARLEHRAELCTSGGALHGGAIMALADSTAGISAYLNLPTSATGTTTVESKTNFLRAVREGSVQATSRPLHVGRSVVVIDTEVRDERGALVARVTQSQLVLGG